MVGKETGTGAWGAEVGSTLQALLCLLNLSEMDTLVSPTVFMRSCKN